MAGWICWLLIIYLLLSLVRQALCRRSARLFASTMKLVYVPRLRELLNRPSPLDALVRHAKMSIGPAGTVSPGQVVIAEYDLHPYWFESLEGRKWLTTPEGRTWLESPDGRAWSELQRMNRILDEEL